MGYVTTDFLKTQFQNYSTKVEEIFRKKSDSYSKKEVNDLIAAVNGMSKTIVDELPTEDISDSTIYFVPKQKPEEVAEVENAYEPEGGNTDGTEEPIPDGYYEYIYLNGQWELLGSTDSVDLEGYLKKDDVEKTNIDFSGFFADEEEESEEEV